MHGDARLANLVAIRLGASAELRWIDLREAAEVSLATAQLADARSLASSILDVKVGVVLPAPVESALSNVESALSNVTAGAADTWSALATAVWAALKGSP